MRLAIIGDYNEKFRPHQATNEAISHSSRYLNQAVFFDWIATDDAETNFQNIVSTYTGFWIAPGSPYKSMVGALKIIQFAREQRVPTLGTCGGFQHMVIEFARHVLEIKEAEHAEYDPYASKLVVNPLSCALAGQTLEIELVNKKSKTYAIFGQDKISEKYYCNFGLNPAYQPELQKQGFKTVGTDYLQEARILELADHPFFIATLFVPQANSTPEQPHPLITKFLEIVLANDQVNVAKPKM